jgi:hypothetical protein
MVRHVPSRTDFEFFFGRFALAAARRFASGVGVFQRAQLHPIAIFTFLA